jgi:hypothetical protein
LSALGIPVKNAFLQHLEFDCNMPKNAIPANIDMFSFLLHKAFGLGAKRIEVKILKNLQQILNLEFDLVDYEWPLSKWVVADFCFKELVLKAMRVAAARQNQ